MGSRRAQAARRERLLAKGMTDAELERIAAPIGLDLGALTAEETALSIMAEIVAMRHGRAGRAARARQRAHPRGRRLRVGGLVLAAGEGARFGGDQAARRRCAAGRCSSTRWRAVDGAARPRVVVLGARGRRRSAGAVDLHGAEPVVCEDWAEGQAASLRAALRGARRRGRGGGRCSATAGVTRRRGARVVAAADAAEEAVAARATYDGVAGPSGAAAAPAAGRVGELRGRRRLPRRCSSAQPVVEVDLAGVANPRDIDTREELATR